MKCRQRYYRRRRGVRPPHEILREMPGGSGHTAVIGHASYVKVRAIGREPPDGKKKTTEAIKVGNSLIRYTAMPWRCFSSGTAFPCCDANAWGTAAYWADSAAEPFLGLFPCVRARGCNLASCRLSRESALICVVRCFVRLTLSFSRPIKLR
jgi:hypothetical protein